MYILYTFQTISTIRKKLQPLPKDFNPPPPQTFILLWNNLNHSKKSTTYKTRRTRGVRIVFSVTRMRSSNSARINKFDFRTEKIV